MIPIPPFVSRRPLFLPRDWAGRRAAVALILAGFPPVVRNAALAADVTLYPDQQRQLITDWGFDVKQEGKAAEVTPAFAQTLFVEDGMTCLRVPIFGNADCPAHPADGQVIGTYYRNILTAIANARRARPGVILFASKKLQGRKSFPSWVLDADGVVPERYARLLADYLAFMAAHGVAFDLLGPDNEMEWNKGNITPEKERQIGDDLKSLSQSRGFKMPKLIAPETFTPNGAWVRKAVELGDELDLVGTHYYPTRPFAKLQELVAAAGNRPLWHTELHEGNPKRPNQLAATVATFLDCTDLGFRGFVWWNYERAGRMNGLERAMTTSTAHTRPVAVSDSQHVGDLSARVIVRAFRGGTRLVVWAVNGTGHGETCLIHLGSGTIGGELNYEQWTSGHSATGAVTPTGPALFEFPLPANSVAQLIFPYTPAPT